MAQTYTYDFEKAKIKNARAGTTPIKTVTIREVTGQDEEVAANTAKAKGGSVSTGEELIRVSIVAVNGAKVSQPYLAFDTWNSRARAFVMKAFNEVNGLSTKEGEDFLATAVDDTAPSASSDGGNVLAIG